MIVVAIVIMIVSVLNMLGTFANFVLLSTISSNIKLQNELFKKLLRK